MQCAKQQTPLPSDWSVWHEDAEHMILQSLLQVRNIHRRVFDVQQGCLLIWQEQTWVTLLQETTQELHLVTRTAKGWRFWMPPTKSWNRRKILPDSFEILSCVSQPSDAIRSRVEDAGAQALHSGHASFAMDEPAIPLRENSNVFLGRELPSQRRVAIKKSARGGEADVEREALILSMLSRCDRIVTFVAFDKDKQWLVTEACAADLQSLLHVLLPIRRMLQFANDMFVALAYLHERRLVHADVQPRNLLVDDEDRLRLADFGTCGSQGEWRSAAMYALWWRPYEIIFGQRVLHCSMDVWAAGVVLGDMLCGDCFFRCEWDVPDADVNLLAKMCATMQKSAAPRRVWDGCSVRCIRERIGEARVLECRCVFDFLRTCLRAEANQREDARALARRTREECDIEKLTAPKGLDYDGDCFVVS